MLSLKNITKQYKTADFTTQALDGVSIEFRKNEFVSILGPSGCGKTTLLNIIGGLDQYTSGDLIIEGKSTKNFTDRDWDAYRNHSIGFVFQSYNLIPHQTVLANVELALTLSGVGKAERRKRAIDALQKVGLGDQLKKKPNQMSGGQMQRVAIARAIVNDPQILLADEPTGALDSSTSEQIMQLLKEIAKDRLVIMVTHNPELAQEYSTRIVRLKDGKITDDSDPFIDSTFEPLPKKKKDRKEKTHMSFFTALSLSLNNLMTKKARTILTAFAGSIGIIGIALILSLSNGVQRYIDRIEEETLSSYPIMIEQSTADIGSMLGSMMENPPETADYQEGYIYANTVMGQLLNTMLKEMTTNNLEAFKAYLESDEVDLSDMITDIQYFYSTPMNIYRGDTSESIIQVNPNTIFETVGFDSQMMEMGASYNPIMASGSQVWKMMLDNSRLLNDQYDVLAGKMPESFDEVVLIVNDRHEVSDYTLYSLGLKDPAEVSGMFERILAGEELNTEITSYTYDEILAQDFRLLLNTDYYEEQDGVWLDMHEDEDYMKDVISSALQLKVVGIICPSEESVAVQENGAVGYNSALAEYLIERINESEIVKAQLADETVDVFSGKPFDTGEPQEIEFDMSSLSPEQQQYFAALSEEERQKLIEQYAAASVSSATYDGNLTLLGVADIKKPSSIYIYPTDFEAKEDIEDMIRDYNKSRDEEYTIRYTDFVGIIMSSVTTIINAISYILIAFVAISLVVSSIMIGIITYISVLERTKEIGILRSIGASKKDISRVFNAETLIIGLAAGLFGIGITLLLCIPASQIIENLTSIAGLAALPPKAGVVLVLISMFLTFIAGLIPSGLAAKKDPVIALRTE